MEKTTAGYDLIVIGAGPAGSACAITAARGGAHVLLLEKDVFPRHKVCGEFVSPESLRLLAWLLDQERFEDKPQIGSARVFSGKKTISIAIAPAARSIARYELDDELLRAAKAAGVATRESFTVRQVDHQEMFMVRAEGETLTARAVVNASGRWSQLTPQLPEKNSAKWIGLKAHFRERHPPDSVDLYFFDGGYCGVQRVSEDVVNACAMVRSSAARSLEQVLARNEALRSRSRDWQPLFPPISTSGLHFRKPQTETKGMLLAGDAAGFIDPFAGDGISLAMHSGTLAARALLPFFKDQCSLEEARRDYHRVYMRQSAPAFRNAARIRMALSAPPMVRSLLIHLAGTRVIGKRLVRGTRVHAPGL